MRQNRAMQIAIACIEQEIRRIAVEANMADQYGAAYPAAIKASARRRELRAAIVALREPAQTRMRI